jgi:hypothetical protein
MSPWAITYWLFQASTLETPDDKRPPDLSVEGIFYSTDIASAGRQIYLFSFNKMSRRDKISVEKERLSNQVSPPAGGAI